MCGRLSHERKATSLCKLVCVADRAAVSLQNVDELAEIAMTAHHQDGEHSKAVEAARLIRSLPRRDTKLQLHGYWKELVQQTQVAHRSRLRSQRTSTVSYEAGPMQAVCSYVLLSGN